MKRPVQTENEEIEVRGYDSEEVSILPAEGLQPPLKSAGFCLMFFHRGLHPPFSCREDAVLFCPGYFAAAGACV